MTNFSQMNLAPPITKALAAEGYGAPTPIQIQAIPLVLEGRDLLGVAQTGTGKTAAFALPILDRLSRAPRPTPPKGARVLVLAPTRELASQIAHSFQTYGRFMRLSVAVVVGGVNINRQIQQMSRGVDILVATPGRLLDLVNRRALHLTDVEALVLDEADQMLDLGFIHALRRIVPLLPAKRQTLLFSATMPKSIAELSKQYLTDPAKVSVAPAATTVELVEQRATYVRPDEKPGLLAAALRDPAMERALVFTRTKRGADRVVQRLKVDGVEAAAIHGNKSQPQRTKALGAFRSGACRVLVATDIAARGIDVDGVSHVFNYDVPNVPEQYVHRIGRTARAGASGLAISYVTDEERSYLRDIEKLTRMKIALEPIPAELRITTPLPKSEGPAPRHGQRQGQRPGPRHAANQGSGPPRKRTRRRRPRAPAMAGA